MTALGNKLPNIETTLKSNIYKDKEELLKDSSYAKCKNFLKEKNEKWQDLVAQSITQI